MDLSSDAPIMFVGDTHGDQNFWGYLLSEADKFDVELIVQVGDFGFWPHTRKGMRYLEILNKYLDRPLLWIDGNHDNHRRLAQLPRRPDGLVDIGTHITHVPRGARFQLSGTSFLGIGGAYSIDKEWRLYEMARAEDHYGQRREQDELWWAGEMVTEDDVQKCLTGGPVDCVLAHDTPLSVSIEQHFVIAGGQFFKADDNTRVNRERLERVLQGCRPRHWINGHYHLPFRETLVEGDYLCRVRALGANVPHEGTVWDPKGAWWIATPGELGAGGAAP